MIIADTTGGNVTLGGLKGGVTGQVVFIVKKVAGNNLILEDNEGDAQDFQIQGGDSTLTAIEGGYICVFNGTDWNVISGGLGTLA